MYCDRCGTQLDESAQFCRACGTPVGGVPALPAQTSITGHVRLVGILWIALSVLRLLPAIAIFSVAHHVPVPRVVMPFLPAVGLLFLAGAVLGLIAGWGLLERQPWSRPFAIVMACFALLAVPFGTALGIYTLWVLLPERAAHEFRPVHA